MNTKFFLLLLLSIFISTSTSSLVSTSVEHEMHLNKNTSSKKETPAQSPPDVQPAKWTSPEPARPHGEKAPLQPEDGKHHRFHFTRMESTDNRKRFELIICKVILTIGHICCFIYCYLHVFHQASH